MRKYREVANTAVEGKPTMFVRQAEKILVYPQPTSGTLSLYYHGEFPALSADSDSNVLTNAAPDLIIYAAATFAADFYLDTRADVFETKFNQFLIELQEQANDQELQGGTQSILPAYSFQDG
jgi:hypothetical protein